jgi:nucleotide-binding universal stress UspA family protein
MSSVILAVLEHQAAAPQTLGAARNVASLMGSARINVLAVRTPPETTILAAEEVLTERQMAKIRDRENQRVRALQASFAAWESSARETGMAAEWIDIEGLADALIGEWGRRSDVIVIERPCRHDGVPDRLAMHAALFDTDRPVLVVPHGGPENFGNRVAIAWRNDKRTRRAVLAALRLLRPGAELHVLAGMRDGAPVPEVPDMIVEHGIAAELHVLPIGAGVFGEMLLKTAHSVGADMLVMGAYTHSAWRDLILGGVTQHMLAHADLPVLMRH